jgi:hypothetical protein
MNFVDPRTLEPMTQTILARLATPTCQQPGVAVFVSKWGTLYLHRANSEVAFDRLASNPDCCVGFYRDPIDPDWLRDDLFCMGVRA